jgi:hypothetical protein
LQYRALVHGVAAARYWDWGDDDREFDSTTIWRDITRVTSI